MTEASSRVAIVGGHGKIALLLTRLLVDRGDEVTSIIRNPDQASDVEAVGGVAKVADVEHMDAAQIAEALAGQQAVVWAAGAGGGSAERTYAVDRDAAIATVDAARACGASRFVMVSYFGAGPDHGVPRDNGFFDYAEAKAAADDYLRGSPSLDWTVLGPSGLTDETGSGKIDASAEEASQVSRANVAAVIAAVLHDPAPLVALSGSTTEARLSPRPSRRRRDRSGLTHTAEEASWVGWPAPVMALGGPSSAQASRTKSGVQP